MEKQKHIALYTLGEEIFNSVSHGLGAAFAIAGTVVLIFLSVLYGDVWAVVSSSIYGGTLIILYTMSTLYHSLTHKKAKGIFRILDHCTIFLLITGTYTPFALITLRGRTGWIIFGIQWAVTVLGIVLNSISIERFKVISIISYLAMGWSVLLALRPLIISIETGGLVLLLVGGVMYTGGLIFYGLKKYRYMHSVWHLFVIAGSVLHYFAILLYVLPATYK